MGVRVCIIWNFAPAHLICVSQRDLNGCGPWNIFVSSHLLLHLGDGFTTLAPLGGHTFFAFRIYLLRNAPITATILKLKYHSEQQSKWHKNFARAKDDQVPIIIIIIIMINNIQHTIKNKEY